MSRERAVRRAERDRARAAAAAKRERHEARARRRRERSTALQARLPRRVRWRGQQGLLARRRRFENGGVGVVLLLSQVLVWLFTDDWWIRGGAALIGVLAVPVLVTLVLDRRGRP